MADILLWIGGILLAIGLYELAVLAAVDLFSRRKVDLTVDVAVLGTILLGAVILSAAVVADAMMARRTPEWGPSKPTAGEGEER